MENIKFYQEIVNVLCEIFHVVRIEVTDDTSLLTEKDAGGQYNPFDIKIVLNMPVIEKEEDDIIEILFHEFRHYWQHCYHPDVFWWWVCESGGMAKKYYWTVFNSIEEDARIFGYTFGHANREDLLMMYDVEDLSLFRDNEEHLHLALQYLGLDGMIDD